MFLDCVKRDVFTLVGEIPRYRKERERKKNNYYYTIIICIFKHIIRSRKRGTLQHLTNYPDAAGAALEMWQRPPAILERLPPCWDGVIGYFRLWRVT